MIAILINDLRAGPVAAAISIARKLKNKNARLFILSESLSFNDYGQTESLLIKKVKVFLLVTIFGAEIYNQKSNKFEQEIVATDMTDTTGIMSSLYSITRDSLATKDKYYNLWVTLAKLNAGAMSFAVELNRLGVKKVFVFNGRLASSYAISKAAKQYGWESFFYEYGDLPRRYLVTTFPLHRIEQWGMELYKYYANNILPIPVNWRLRDKLVREKLSNKYTKHYKNGSKTHYDVSIFLTSTHEYMALDQDLCKVSMKKELDFVKEVIARNGRSLRYAVRCHPNQANDPSWEETLSPLIIFCSANSIDLFLPDSEISSYDLIDCSNLVAVDISTIGLDAILKNRPVQIYGNRGYRYVYEKAIEKLGSDSNLVTDFVGKVMSLRGLIFQHEYSLSAFIWFLAAYPIEAIYHRTRGTSL